MGKNTLNNKDTILIVDDHPSNIKVIAEILNNEYSLSFANSAENALKTIENIMPDLILLDIMMPGMDGFEFCRLLKESRATSSIPVIFITARMDVSDIVHAFDCGGVDYITKPFNQRELKVRVQNHLDLYHARNQARDALVKLLISESEIKKVNLQLNQINQDKNRFFSILAHDLRNPFQSLLGYSQLLTGRLSQLSVEEITDYSQQIHQTAQSTYQLLGELLEWGRIQNGNITYNVEGVKLAKSVETIFEHLRLMAANKNISLQSKVSEDFNVWFDKHKLDAVLRNLTLNALKFTNRGGTICIDASEYNSMVLVSVEDNGIGMSHEKLLNLFRLDKSLSEMGTEGEEGSGMGLLLCREYIEKHNGTIWAESQPGIGTTFYFTIPRDLSSHAFQ